MTMHSNDEAADLASLSADKPEVEMPTSITAPIDGSSASTAPQPAANTNTDDVQAQPSAEESTPETSPHNDTGASSPMQKTTHEVTASEAGPWEDVTSDGKVKKRIVKAGSGQVPELHSVCLVHYVGKHKEDDSVFADTRNEKEGEPVTLVAGRELVKRNQGLNAAVAKMLVGEVCEVEVMPEYGFGEKGSFSFPCVKPNAILLYQLELVASSPPADKKKSDMFFEERLEAAQRLRLQGNELFRNQDFKEALNRNKIALDYIDDELLFQLQGRYLDDAHAVKAPLHLNSAACHLKLEDWAAAAEEASECMKLLGSDSEELAAKALFRRAKAYAGGGRTEDAMKDLEKAKQLYALLTSELPPGMSCVTLSAWSHSDPIGRRPNDAAVVQEMVIVKKLQKENDAAVAKLFRNKLPAGSKGLSDPITENQDQDVQDGDADVQDVDVLDQNDVPPASQEIGATETTPVFLAIIEWIIRTLQSILSSFGITVRKREQHKNTC